PKLPRYQAALYPAGHSKHDPEKARPGCGPGRKPSSKKIKLRQRARTPNDPFGTIAFWPVGYMVHRPPARRPKLGALRTTTQGAALLFEHGASDPVARRDTELARSAADDFQHGADRPARGNQAIRQRLGILRDPQDAAVGADEDHVERDVGVVHPERDRTLALEI